jgi:hypothetical protein
MFLFRHWPGSRSWSASRTRPGVAAEGAPPADMVPDQCIVVFHDNTPNLRHGAL